MITMITNDGAKARQCPRWDRKKDEKEVGEVGVHAEGI